MDRILLALIAPKGQKNTDGGNTPGYRYPPNTKP